MQSRTTPRNAVLAALAQRVLVGDGAMGTMLYARGLTQDTCLEALNLDDPSLVQALHTEYLAAGADILETNTFGANAVRLASYGRAREMRAINIQGVAIARQAAQAVDRPVFVAGAVGPLGPDRPRDTNLWRQLFREQVEALAEGGVDLIILETFNHLDELREAMQAVREGCSLPMVAQATAAPDGCLASGQALSEAVKAMLELGADVVGVNCVDPSQAFLLLSPLPGKLKAHLSVYASAGLPRTVQGRLAYPEKPEAFDQYAKRMAGLGVRIIGGCCGTTPQHIASVRRALDSAGGSTTPDAGKKSIAVGSARPALEEVQPRTLREKLAAGRFVVSVEVDPPRGLILRRTLEGAALLKEAGADCINVGDSPMARARMSAIAMAVLMQQQVGVETIVHLTTRDRNTMAIHADLLGAHVLGIRNVLCLRGDVTSLGGYPDAVGVWDVSATGLIRILKLLNNGMDWSGKAIGQAASFLIGASANPTAASLEQEMKLLRRKKEAGADFVMTQALFDPVMLDAFLEKVKRLQLPVIVGIMLLHNYRNTEFLHRQVPGMVIPDEIRERMRRAGDPGGPAEGLAIAREMVDAIREKVAGIYIIPSFGHYERAAELVVLARG